MKSTNLPFELTATPKGKQTLLIVASVNGHAVTNGRTTLGSRDSRRKLAEELAGDERLHNGSTVEADRVELAIEKLELSVGNDADSSESIVTPGAAYCDSRMIVELAWNLELAEPDFIIFDRQAATTTRADNISFGGWTLTTPPTWQGIVTPGGSISGTVFVPTESVAHENDQILRRDVLAFIHRYVELPGEAEEIAAEYVFLSWAFDDFDELPYAAFRTSDAGRGKSRALETVGTLCYRPIFCGGGSTAAATLRLCDLFGGTLVCDEFDGRKDSDLTSEIAKIINQGFQRNRPIIKCVGEGSEPKAFRCFGPKLFALRQNLGDDASESRTLSISMAQRTRDNIPLNLPRTRFDAEALELRNRLLGWRFSRLGTFEIDSAYHDPRLEDRGNQIGAPLLAIAGDNGRARIVDALIDQQGGLQATRGDSLAGEVFVVILDLVRDDGIVRPGLVAQEFNRRRARDMGFERDGEPDVSRLRDSITSHKVGWLMKSTLELTRLDKRDANGTVYRLSRNRGETLCFRYGLAPERLPTLQHCNSREDCQPEDPSSGTKNRDSCNNGNPCNVSGTSGTLQGLGLEIAIGRNLLTDLVPNGWEPLAFADHLEGVAKKCEGTNPEIATQHRQKAADIRALLTKEAR